MKCFVVVVRIIWLSLSILILFFSLYRLSQLQSIRDISELISIMSYGMILISLPAGIVFIIILSALDLTLNIMHISSESKYLKMIAIWFIFLLGGYIQWFYLFEKIVKKPNIKKK
ncbi:hypothetical protein EKN65_22730 [Enterobacter cloacae]|nr:hypothetical protein EKN65_22730 [Enterobacter cloacae]